MSVASIKNNDVLNKAITDSESQKSIVMPVLNEEQQHQLRAILEQGIPHTSTPYLAIAEQINCDEQQVISQIEQWQNSGLIRRFGLVVKHRKLGYTANAMVVWDINASDIETIAAKLSARPEVSLCYQRPRRLPDWPYNLFCMIHGTCREKVLTQINDICDQLSLQHINKDILFSNKAYKQKGGRYCTTSTNNQKVASHDS